jgi:hypothetical protein
MQEAAPIGACEDHRTEFKRQDALRKLEPISHAVVSMLNAAGGNVWIGVIEQDERWVGVEPIADAENEARRLQDHLIATIEPSPSAWLRGRAFSWLAWLRANASRMRSSRRVVDTSCCVWADVRVR